MTDVSDLPVDPPLRRPPPLPANSKPKRRHWMLWLVFGFSLLLNLLWLNGGFSFGWMEVGSREYPDVDATLAWGDSGAEAKVAVLRLQGVILREGTSTLFGEEVDPVTQLLGEIQAVTMDPSYDAILLMVDSPGGGVTASDDIYRALMAFKGSRADRIVAQPTSLVGSIGVMMSALNMHKLGEKLGIEDVTLASSDNKALLNALQPVDPEHREILQQVVDDMYDRFRMLVLKHRPFDAEFADEHHLLDGRVFTLPAARELGLVDDVGYEDTARITLMTLLGADSVALYDVSYVLPGFSLFSARAPQVNTPSGTCAVICFRLFSAAPLMLIRRDLTIFLRFSGA